MAYVAPALSLCQPCQPLCTCDAYVCTCRWQFLEVVTSSLTSGPVVECVVDLGDATEPRKCDVCVAELEKLSELPFVLTDGCKASGDAALIGLSIVDLFIRRTVQIEYMPPGREAFREVGDAKTTTPAQLRAATAFRVTVMTN